MYLCIYDILYVCIYIYDILYLYTCIYIYIHIIHGQDSLSSFDELATVAFLVSTTKARLMCYRTRQGVENIPSGYD